MVLKHMPKFSVAEYELLPETGPRYQLIDGDMYMAPAPNRYHQDISRNLELILTLHVREQKLGKLYHAPFDVYLSEHDVFQPDILFVSKERAHILTARGAEGAPDLVVEILSPKTAQIDLEFKRRGYARFGVQELWIIEPILREIRVYRFAEDPEKPVATFTEGELMTTPIFPQLTIDTREVFEQ